MLRCLVFFFACSLSVQSHMAGETACVTSQASPNVAPSFALPEGARGPAGGNWTAQPNSGHSNWRSLTCSADGAKLAGLTFEGRIYTSTDFGVNWTVRGDVQTWRSIASSADGTRLAAVAAPGRIYTSTDSGVSWTARENTRNWSDISSSADGTKLAAVAAPGKIYTSTDSGLSWTERENSRNWATIASSADGTRLAAAVYEGPLCTSTDSGVTWTEQTFNHRYRSIASSADGKKLVVVSRNDTIETSRNSGKSWISRDGIRTWTSVASSADGTRLAALDYFGSIHTSTDSGETWIARSSEGSEWISVTSSADGTRLAAASGGQIYTSVGEVQPYVLTVVADSGPIVSEGFATGISAGPAGESDQAVHFTVTNSNPGLFARQPGLDAGGTLAFTPVGIAGRATITVIAHDTGGIASGGVDTSQPQTFEIDITAVPPNARPSFKLPAEGSAPAGAVWTAQPGAGVRGWSAIASSADGTKLAAVVYDGAVYTSTDSGLNWVERPAGIGYWLYIASSADGTKLVAARNDGVVSMSADSGVSWTERGPGHQHYVSLSLSADGTQVVVVDYTGKLYVSADFGVNWMTRDSFPDWDSATLSADGKMLVAVQRYGPIYTSTDFGVSWTAHGIARSWESLASSVDGTRLVATTLDQLFTSTDSGMTWTEQDSDHNAHFMVSSADGSKLAGAGYSGIYTSPDFGLNWFRWAGSRSWHAIATSADGMKLAALVHRDQIYTSKEIFHTLTVTADHGLVTTGSFATNISPGSARESAQAVSFTVTNDHEELFSSQPQIDASGTLTFVPKVSARGTAIVTVTAVDNGGTANGGINTSAPQRFAITIVPKLVVSGAGVVIPDADVTPSPDDHTDFGTVPLSGQRAVRRFVMASLGPAPLHFTGSAPVQISGPASQDFMVTASPARSLAPGGSTEFDITFDPTLPGVRRATVTISTDDPSLPVATFAVVGFGRVSRLRNQSITFTLPPKIAWSTTPWEMNAFSTSGLPVTFRVISGPGTMSGSRLICGLPGVIKVQASQAGDGSYAPAPPVVRTLNVVGFPGKLQVFNPPQVYDGSPKPLSPDSLIEGSIVTYQVGGIPRAEAPSEAGTYSVTVTVPSLDMTATAPLVIAKAPLYVTPDDQRKLAGQANPGLTYKITGFRGTDTEAVLTRMPVIKTTAGMASPGGEYVITASGTEAENYTIIYQQGTLTVDSFGGSYEALLVNDSGLIVGKLLITVAGSSTAFSARLTTAAESVGVTFTGRIVTDPSLERATASASMMKSGVPYAIQFTLPLKGGRFAVSATRDGAAFGGATDGRKLSTTKVGHAGIHTVVMEPAAPSRAGIPAGAGWATAVINDKGVLALAGRLGDGSPFTCALSPDEMLDPGYRLFLQPYFDAISQTDLSGRPLPGKIMLVPRPQCLLAGSFDLLCHPSLPNRRYLAAAGMTWKKAGRTTDASYRAGFGPVSTVLMLDPWLKPREPTLNYWPVSLSDRLGLSVPNFAVTHSASGSASDADLPVRLAISSTNAVSVLSPSSNLTKWKATTFNAANGTFTGSFELIDEALKRPVTFSGVLRQPTDSQDALIGAGHYLLAPMTGTEKSTGELNLQRP